MKRLKWLGLLGLIFLLTIACSLRLRTPSRAIEQAIAVFNDELEDELVRDVIIVTPLWTLTPTPTPTITPTITITLPVAALPGEASPDAADGDPSATGASGDTSPTPGLSTPTAPASPTILPSPTAAAITTAIPVPPTATLLPTATVVPPTATSPPPDDDDDDDGGGSEPPTSQGFTVNVVNDQDDGSCNSTHCSLREAINRANANPGSDTISFNIAGSGPHTIKPNSELPRITDPVTIDGTTQPGADCSSWPPILLIELDGSDAGADFTANGLFITGGNSTVRGLVINNSRSSGLQLESSNNTVQCNFIGTDVNGTSAQPNLGEGVTIIDGAGNLIGEQTGRDRNLISGNSSGGLGLYQTATTNNLVQGNFIGTDKDGTSRLGNGGNGVTIFGASGNVIGGTVAGAGNRIAHNSNTGVVIEQGTGNAILGNSIVDNGGLGIDIEFDGVTANDSGDGDSGSNNRQNFPVLTAGISIDGNVSIDGSLDSLPNTTFRLEFFANESCDSSGNGEGEIFLGALTETSGVEGLTFSGNFPAPPVGSRFFTATATDPNGNTSEFSACQTAISLYVSSRNSDQVLRYDGTTGAFIDVFASGGGLNEPTLGLTFGPDSNLYVSSGLNDQILRFNGSTGDFIDLFAGGSGLDQPLGLTFGPDDNLYVSSANSDEVLRFDGSNGTFIDNFASGGGLDEPRGLTFGPDGNLYVSSAITDAILRYDGTTGAFIDIFASGGGLNGPTDLVFGFDDNLYVTSSLTNQILRYNGASGTFVDAFASGGGLDTPTGLTFGPDGNLYVSSFLTNQILRYDGSTGAFIDIFASGGGLNGPDGLILR